VSSEYVLGEEHLTQAAASSLHWNVTFEVVDLKLKVAERSATVPDGPEVIVVFGAAARAGVIEARTATTANSTAVNGRGERVGRGEIEVIALARPRPTRNPPIIVGTCS
jgi:hypothetical protein